MRSNPLNSHFWVTSLMKFKSLMQSTLNRALCDHLKTPGKGNDSILSDICYPTIPLTPSHSLSLPFSLFFLSRYRSTSLAHRVPLASHLNLFPFALGVNQSWFVTCKEWRQEAMYPNFLTFQRLPALRVRHPHPASPSLPLPTSFPSFLLHPPPSILLSDRNERGRFYQWQAALCLAVPKAWACGSLAIG